MILNYVSNIPISILVLDELNNIVYLNNAFIEDTKNITDDYQTLIGENVSCFLPEFKGYEHDKKHMKFTFDKGKNFYNCIISIRNKENNKLIYIERPDEFFEKKIKYDFTIQLSKRIKSPLITIVKMLSLISTTSLTEEQQTYVDTMKENSIDILKVNNDLTEYFKLLIEPHTYSVNPIYIYFNEITENITDVVKSKIKKNSISLQFIHNNEEIYTDYQKLMHVMVNTIYNSIKHTKNGYILVKISKEKTDIKIYIQDTGISMTSKEVKLIESISQNVDYMNNIELPIAKKLTEMLGGDIKIEYTNNSGTLISLSFPS